MGSTIILDTNVVSEMMRETPDPVVAAWYVRQSSNALYTTTVTSAEVLYGIDLMPRGKRRDRLRALAEEFFEIELDGKVLPFDQKAAGHYAFLRAAKRLKGVSISSFDAQIAGIAAAQGASVATRNTEDFRHCGVTLINPWEK